jgi:uncharacterized protein
MPEEEVPEPELVPEPVPDPEPAPEPEPEQIPLTPVARQERIAAMDVLRGLAVLGIFLINMPLYVGPMNAFFNWENNPYWTSVPDRLATLFIYIFAQGKFYTLFSFLFGLGFGVQLMRATERHSPNFLSTFRRRLSVLLAIGVLHFFLVWWGDVLHVYALLGFLLIFFRERSDKTLAIWIAALTFLPLTLASIGTTVEHFTRKEPTVEEKKKEAERKEQSAKRLMDDVKAYSSAPFPQLLAHRFQGNLRHLPGEIGWSTELFANFLIGLWVSRRRILQDPQSYRPLLTKLAYIALPLAILITTADQVWGYQHPGADTPHWRTLLGLFREFLCRPAMAYGYAALLLLIGIKSWMSPFAAVGRMALTNYLLHSLVWTTVANSYGMGLYGKIHPLQGLIYCFAFYALQLPFSVLWLKVFNYGPAEWAWRSLTYGKAQPFRRQAA